MVQTVQTVKSLWLRECDTIMSPCSENLRDHDRCSYRPCLCFFSYKLSVYPDGWSEIGWWLRPTERASRDLPGKFMGVNLQRRLWRDWSNRSMPSAWTPEFIRCCCLSWCLFWPWKHRGWTLHCPLQGRRGPDRLLHFLSVLQFQIYGREVLWQYRWRWDLLPIWIR